ncbi:DUF6980 family protein [Geosporobacter ferrireducens]|uniref:DUF6980 domain-containing protein n=1 Tax=Geosporobacter ferrireducens TaxID=1424294 RepID=A0A1D8GBN5_9FIRM|nr:hypothetical protein Gferi_01160 [Geosporobacter ferrireducens]
MMTFCCEDMKNNINTNCCEHNEKFQCSDSLIYYDLIFDEYGLIVHDGGNSYILIKFCPWCGAELPESKRDKWFEELEQLGYDSPYDKEIPQKYKSDKWYR